MIKPLYCICLLFIITLFSCSKPIDFDELSQKNNLFYQDGELFSGEAVQITDTSTLLGLLATISGDSIVYDIENGFCVEQTNYIKDQIHTVLSHEKKGDNLFSTLQIYGTLHSPAASDILISKTHFRNNIKHGKSTEWSFTDGMLGSKKAWKFKETTFNKGVKHGPETFFYEDGRKKEEVNFVQGQTSGLVKSWYPSGNLKKVSKYENNAIVYTKNYYDRKNVISSKVKYNQKYGQEETKWSLNNKILSKVRGFDSVKIVLDGYYEFLDGEKETHLNFKNGLKNGKEVVYYWDGTKWEETNYKYGKLNGPHKKWYRNGQIALSENFVNHLKNGKESKWYETGQKHYEYQYNNGVKTRKWTLWYKNGTLAEETKYKNGKPYGTVMRYYDNGDKWKKYVYTQKSEGLYCLYKSWFTDGAKAEEYEMLNDLQHGYYKKWWGNGNLRLVVHYTNGKKNGKYKNWLENGKLYEECTYLMDKKNK